MKGYSYKDYGFEFDDLKNIDFGGVQVRSLEKPKVKKHIILTLFCVKCGTFRNFLVDVALDDLICGKTKYIQYALKCSKCGNKFGVRIGWVDTKG